MLVRNTGGPVKKCDRKNQPRKAQKRWRFVLIKCVIGAFFLFATSPAYAQDIDIPIDFSQFEVKGVNLSDAFVAQIENADITLSPLDLEHLRHHQIVFVPGFLSDWGGSLRSYLKHHIQWLKDREIEPVVVATRSHESHFENAKKIKEAIMAFPRKSFIYTHSRGGIETLLALIQFPEIREKIGGVIFVQSPFYGTWIADRAYAWCESSHPEGVGELTDQEIKDCLTKFLNYQLGSSSLPYVNEWMNSIQDLGRGLWTTIKSLRSIVRHNENQKYRDLIRTFLDEDQFKVLFVTTADMSESWRLTAYEFFRRQMRELGILNDGVVPSSSMILEGAPYVRIPGELDHSALVTSRRGEDLKKLSQRVFELSLRHILSGTP